ncbi:hypothetical protein K2X89_00310 [Myxococcota bacterium]|nr:hypothetical protein [Myxococcota bacterium]
MDLQRESAPEARRLLQLARTDRRAAEKALASLQPERQAELILDTALPIRRQLIELLPSPEEVIPLLPEAELCYTLRTIGLSDVSWLLPLATDEQLVACIDLDAWRGLRLDPVRLDAWFAALAESDSETLARAAMAMDPEVLVLYLREHIEVFVKPGPQENPDWSEPDQSQTLEGQFYFVARKAGDDLAPLMQLLHALFQADYWLYFRAIQAIREESETENAEWALRWRTGRMEDLGFPSWDSAMRIYGFLRPEKRVELPAEAPVLDLEGYGLPAWTSVLPAEREGERALFRAIRELSVDERGGVFHALVSLANRIAVADRMELGDPESLPKAIDKATRYASDGLELLARENGLGLEQALRRASLERLFRVGINLDREAALPSTIDPEDDAGGHSEADDDGDRDADDLEER